MKTWIYLMLCFGLLARFANGESLDNLNANERLFLGGTADGEGFVMIIFAEGEHQVIPRQTGTRFINIEPGCIMVEAFVTEVNKNEVEIRMPHPSEQRSRAMAALGTDSPHIVVSFTPTEQTNGSGKIVTIRPKETKPTK